MSLVALVHWNEAEGRERADRLRRAGHTVEIIAGQLGSGARDVRKNPPDVFVIDLSRLPSQGRAVATFFRQKKATRRVPIVFVGGVTAKVARTRELLPDATYTDWRHVRSSIRSALAHAPAEPVVVGTFEEYAASPLPKKLGIRSGVTVGLLGAPDGFEETLGTLPAEVSVQRRPRRPVDVALLFVRSMKDLERSFPAAAGKVAKAGRMWIVWPKKTSGLAGDLNLVVVRKFGLAASWVDYKIAAIDRTWSGLCFTLRSSQKR